MNTKEQAIIDIIKQMASEIGTGDGESGRINNDLFKEMFALGDFLNYHVVYEENPNNDAITIATDEIGHNEQGKFTLYAIIQEDWYTWINFFVAVFDDGVNWVAGDFENVVVASNAETFKTFKQNIVIEFWDYADI